ncbi:hypothetical protein PISMIDRAFT_685907 [Pisolithus microcarpus 441]|uniref:Uncharacterized protein n=1 Tax=Pisolithus microcarpus 441 TaxID=765257 RepID=A0A0C9YSH2_9AGAM|nr:hypothetical protein PISMIDRAFT_685907 [Pisolithus microcarpus 441]
MMAFFSKRRRSSNTVGRISTCYKRQTMWSETGFGSSTHSYDVLLFASIDRNPDLDHAWGATP